MYVLNGLKTDAVKGRISENKREEIKSRKVLHDRNKFVDVVRLVGRMKTRMTQR